MATKLVVGCAVQLGPASEGRLVEVHRALRLVVRYIVVPWRDIFVLWLAIVVKLLDVFCVCSRGAHV